MLPQTSIEFLGPQDNLVPIHRHLGDQRACIYGCVCLLLFYSLRFVGQSVAESLSHVFYVSVRNTTCRCRETSTQLAVSADETIHTTFTSQPPPSHG